MRCGIGLVLCLTLLGCNPSVTRSDKVQVVATTSMVTDLVKAIGGDRVAVTGLMGANIDPHDYQASAADIETLASAQIIFYNGHHLEGQMGEIFERMAQRKHTVAVTKDIPAGDLRPVEGFEGGYDPHVWFNVKLWMKAAETVRDQLSEYDPAGAATYQANAARYLKELADLDDYVRKQASTLPPEQRVVITAHDAFAYFGQAYGFEVRGLQGVNTAVEAAPKDVTELAEFIVRRKVPALFVEASVNDKNLKAVQQAVAARGWQVKIGDQLYSDALGNPGTPEGTYIGMIKYNIDAIVRSLKQ